MTCIINCINSFTEPDPSYSFIKPLPKNVDGFTLHETYMECTVSSSIAIVHWYKGTEKITVRRKTFLCKNDQEYFFITKKISKPHNFMALKTI